jgi:hypothetical protein
MKMFRIVTYVPETHADRVRAAIGEAGGGTVGNYSHCSFSTPGTGRFIPLEGAKPAIGLLGTLEEVREERIEFYCPESLVEKVAAAIRAVHPYEEVPIDASEIQIL